MTSRAKNVEKSPGRLTMRSGKGMSLKRGVIPISAEASIPISMAPLTLFVTSTIVMINPTIVSKLSFELKSPRATMVAGFFTTIPPCTRPIKAIKTPMAIPIACLIGRGIASMTILLSCDSDKMRTMRPSIHITPMATCQEYPRDPTMVKATTAFIPMPGARASG